MADESCLSTCKSAAVGDDEGLVEKKQDCLISPNIINSSKKESTTASQTILRKQEDEIKSELNEIKFNLEKFKSYLTTLSETAIGANNAVAAAAANNSNNTLNTALSNVSQALANNAVSTTNSMHAIVNRSNSMPPKIKSNNSNALQCPLNSSSQQQTQLLTSSSQQHVNLYTLDLLDFGLLDIIINP